MRGSFCQALPIGCIRVFMTPSCSSAVTLDSRCSGTLNSVSSLRREISSSWLRVSTSSDTIVIRCSSVSTLTRIDWLATLSASCTRRGDRLDGRFGGGGLGGGLGRLRAGFGSWRRRAAARARRSGDGATGAVGGAATSIAVSRNARSSSSSDTSPGRNGRSSTCGTRRALRHRGLRRQPPARPAQMRPAPPTLSSPPCHAPPSPASSSIRSWSEPSGSASVASSWPRISLMRSIVVRISVTASPGHRHAVAEFAHQRLAGMRQRFQPRQPEEAAGALDGVDQAKNVIEYLGVVRFLLEPHQLIVDGIQALAGLRQKLPQKIIHQNTPSKHLCCGCPSTILRVGHPDRAALWPAGCWRRKVLVPLTQPVPKLSSVTFLGWLRISFLRPITPPASRSR